MSFGHAVHALKRGQKVARSDWNGKGMWLALQTPEERSKMSIPYVYMNTAYDQLVPWWPSQPDILADDWRIVPKSLAATAFGNGF